MADQQEKIFQDLMNVIREQDRLLSSIAEKLQQIESIGGGGGSASIEDYQSGQVYKRNTLLVDRDTETVYRVLAEPSYTSVTVESDVQNKNLKLVGFESQVITIDHNPSQAEIDTLPQEALVAVYSSMDAPYVPDFIDPNSVPSNNNNS